MSENKPQPQSGRPTKATATYTEVSVSGPIPPPQILQQYNAIVPDAAQRIILMAEKQSEHRMDLEKKVVESNIFKSYLGMGLATVIALYGLYIAKEIAINGNPWAAGIIGTLDLGGLISIAIYNGLIQNKEREKRRQASAAPPTSS